MVKRVIQLISILAVAAVTAGGGVALAQPAHHKAVAQKTATPSASRAAAERTAGADPDAVRSGDQTTPDSQRASSQEQPGSESSGDGPGGHEDEAGAEVDHQFEGEE
jgi:hypothetical protein